LTIYLKQRGRTGSLEAIMAKEIPPRPLIHRSKAQ